MAATSALTASAPNRAGNNVYAATIAVGASVLMGVGGLGAAYLATRYPSSADFVDPKMKFNNYAGVVTLGSLLLASFAVGWAATSARIGQRRWASTGFGLSALIGLAALNLVWFIGQHLEFGVNSSAYSVLVYALLIAGGLAIAGGVFASIAGLASSFGGHASPSSPSIARAAAWGQHIATLSWLIVFALIFLKK